MPISISSLALDVATRFQESVGRLKTNPTAICPSCGGSIEINLDPIASPKKTIDD